MTMSLTTAEKVNVVNVDYYAAATYTFLGSGDADLQSTVIARRQGVSPSPRRTLLR